jgi:hypothetical protein
VARMGEGTGVHGILVRRTRVRDQWEDLSVDGRTGDGSG